MESINREIVNRACAPSSLHNPDTDLSKLRETHLVGLKRRFVSIAREICPAWQVSDEQRQTIADIFDWCIMADDSYYNPRKGLLLMGNIGTGKSTMLEIVKRFCRIVRPPHDLKGDGYFVAYSFRITNAIDVCDAFSRDGYAGIDTYIDSDRQAFDELGSECVPTGHYGTAENVMQYVLQRRYDKRFTSFTHATTNLTCKQICEMYGARIYDRCKEMFNFVELNGRTWRRN